MFFYLDNANSRHGVSLTHCRANRFDATHFKDYFLHVSELRFADEAEIELQRSFRRSGLMVQVFDLQTLRTFFAAHQRLEAENDALKASAKEFEQRIKDLEAAKSLSLSIG